MAGAFHPPIFFLFLTKRIRAVDGPKEKIASAGRFAQSAYLRPPAGGWLAFPRGRQHQTRRPWGNLGSGEVPDTLPSSFRWRWPGGKRGPTRASAPTVCRRESVERTPLQPPCRGGCPHPPVSGPPSTTRQSASGFRKTGLSTTTPRSLPDRRTRGQSNANAQVRREPVEDSPVFVGTDSEDPRT